MTADALTLLLTASLVLVIGVLIFILPQKRILERENRVAASLPRFSVERLASGEFARGVADFYDDQLPFRDGLIALRSGVELLLFGGRCGDVIAADDGYLIDRTHYSEENYSLIKKNISGFLELGGATGLETTVAVVPRGVDVMKCKLSGLLRDRDAVWELLPEGAVTFDGMLSCHADMGEYVWYRTDHHYTTLGAYLVYRELAEELGYDPYPIEFFTPAAVSDDFLGTSFSSSGLPSARSDTITLFRFEGDEEYTVTYGETVMAGFYDLPRLEGRDKYSVFLGGNHGLTEIKKNNVRRPTLIMIKDSYAHSLAPFLALHFDLELIDPRYCKEDMTALISESRADRLLMLCGIDTLASADLTPIMLNFTF